MKLSDICDYATDRTNISALNKSNYISTENMLPNKSGITLAATLPTTTQIPAYKIDDVLVSNIRPYFKKIWKANFDGGCSADVLVFRVKENVNSDFLYYVLSSDKFFEYSMATSKGTKMPRGDKKSIMEFEVPNFDFPTQKKIAEVLSCLDSKIELNRRINENLEQQAGAIFKEWFVDNAKAEWKKLPIDSVFDISIGKTPPRKEAEWFSENKNSENIEWISISDMGKSGMYINESSEYLTKDAIKKFNIQIIPDNTVLLSFKLTIGRVAITDGLVTTNEAIAHFKTDKVFFTEYLYCFLKNFRFETLGSTSSIATAINSKIVKSMPFILPDEETLILFHEKVKPLFLMIKENQHQSQTLTQIRDALLPKLMNGEIEV